MRLDKKIEKIGEFWLPDNPEVKFFGNLLIDENGHTSLKLLGNLHNIRPLENFDEIFDIEGKIEDFNYIKLVDCLYTHLNFNANNLCRAEIFAHIALLCKNEEIAQNKLFQSYRFKLDYLGQWMLDGGVNHTFGNDNTITMTYSQPSKLRFNISDDFDVEIFFQWSATISSTIGSNSFNEDVYIRLLSIRGYLPLKVFIETSNRIKNLISFITSRPNFISESFISHEIDDEIYDYESIQLLYESLNLIESKNDSLQMLFYYPQVREKIDLLFKNWLSLYNNIEPTLKLFFSVLYSNNMYIESKFLAYAQALESLHRRTTNERLMSEEAYNALCSTLENACPTEHLEWLKGKLKYGNEISFRKRIKQTIEPFQELIGEKKSINNLINKILITRNYMTHYDIGIENQSANFEELMIVNMKIELILIVNILSLVGFTSDEINAIITRNWKLSEIKDLKFNQ